jgi:hypothetical protein
MSHSHEDVSVARLERREKGKSIERAGWSVAEFAAATSLSKTKVYQLLNAADGMVEAVFAVGRTVITTSPQHYLANCPKYRQGASLLRGGVDPANPQPRG